MTRRFTDISDRTRADIRAHYEKEATEADELARLRDQVTQGGNIIARVRATLSSDLEDRLKVKALTMYLDSLGEASTATPGPCGHCQRSWDDCTADHVRTGRRCCYSCGHEATSQEGT